MDVRMPDGVILRGIPDGTTKEAILAKYNSSKMPEVAETPVPAAEVGDPFQETDQPALSTEDEIQELRATSNPTQEQSDRYDELVGQGKPDIPPPEPRVATPEVAGEYTAEDARKEWAATPNNAVPNNQVGTPKEDIPFFAGDPNNYKPEEESPFELPEVGTKATAPGESITNKDGSQSSEVTKTFGVNIEGEDKFILLPTVVLNEDDVLEQVSDDEALRLWNEGKNDEVGKFDTEDEANQFAGKRSEAGGRFSGMDQETPPTDLSDFGVTDEQLNAPAKTPFEEPPEEVAGPPSHEELAALGFVRNKMDSGYEPGWWSGTARATRGTAAAAGSGFYKLAADALDNVNTLYNMAAKDDSEILTGARDWLNEEGSKAQIDSIYNRMIADYSTPENAWLKIASEGIRAIPDMAAVIATTALTRNPNAGYAVMGAQVFSDTYGRSRYQDEKSIEHSFYDASAATAYELGGERAFSVLEPIAQGLRGGKQLLMTSFNEGMSEIATEGLTIADELTRGGKPFEGVGRTFLRLGEAGLIGTVPGAGMHVGGNTIQRINNKMNGLGFNTDQGISDEEFEKYVAEQEQWLKDNPQSEVLNLSWEQTTQAEPIDLGLDTPVEELPKLEDEDPRKVIRRSPHKVLMNNPIYKRFYEASDLGELSASHEERMEQAKEAYIRKAEKIKKWKPIVEETTGKEADFEIELTGEEAATQERQKFEEQKVVEPDLPEGFDPAEEIYTNIDGEEVAYSIEEAARIVAKFDETETEESDTLTKARNGDKDAQDQLTKFGLGWDGNRTKYRKAGKAEIDKLMSGETVSTSRHGGEYGTDITDNADYAKVGADSTFRITYKNSKRFDTDQTNSETREKNKEEGEFHLANGYTLEDVETIEKQQADGSWKVIHKTKAKKENKDEKWISVTEMDGSITKRLVTREERDQIEVQLDDYRQKFDEEETLESPRSEERESRDIVIPQDEVWGSTVEEIDPATLTLNPKLMQYKSGTDTETGRNKQLEGITTFDASKAGIILAWEDVNGNRVVADGHQRVNLLNELQAQGREQGTKILTRVYREDQGFTAKDVRTIAAEINIAQGTGTALDAAKVIKELSEAEQVELLKRMPVNSALVRDALGLSKLGEEAFQVVVNDLIEPRYGSMIGNAFEESEQTAAMQILIKSKPSTFNEAYAMIADIQAGGFVKSEQGGLFGEVEMESLIKERAQILSAAESKLRKNVTVFNALTREEKRIEDAGNKLDTETNKKIAKEAGSIIDRALRTINTNPELNNELNRIAKDFKDGTISKAEAANQFVEAATAYSDGSSRKPTDEPGNEGTEQKEVKKKSKKKTKKKPSQITLTEEVQVEETGEVVVVSENAAQALMKLDKRITVLKQLKDCILK